MGKTYVITDQFFIKGCRILALNEKRDAAEYGAANVLIDGVCYPCRPTHNDYWIQVGFDPAFADQALWEGDKSLVGKTLEFVS